jgi:hypothetical protein
MGTEQPVLHRPKVRSQLARPQFRCADLGVVSRPLRIWYLRLLLLVELSESAAQHLGPDRHAEFC